MASGRRRSSPPSFLGTFAAAVRRDTGSLPGACWGKDTRRFTDSRSPLTSTAPAREVRRTGGTPLCTAQQIIGIVRGGQQTTAAQARTRPKTHRRWQSTGWDDHGGGTHQDGGGGGDGQPAPLSRRIGHGRVGRDGNLLPQRRNPLGDGVPLHSTVTHGRLHEAGKGKGKGNGAGDEGENAKRATAG